MRKISYLFLCLFFLTLVFPQLGSASSKLLMFDADYCSWCQLWEKEIGVIYGLTPEHCQAPLKRFDISENLPESIILNEPINYTPTFVLLYQQNEVSRIIGYPSEDFFWPMLDDMINANLPEEIRLSNASQCSSS